jgi:hypothetical protein
MSDIQRLDSDSGGRSGETVVGAGFSRGFRTLLAESLRTQQERIEIAVKKSP